MDARKVLGQVKHRPLHGHVSFPNSDPFRDNAEGTEGGNSDPLCMEEKGRAKGLRLEEELKAALCGDCAFGLGSAPAHYSTQHKS